MPTLPFFFPKSGLRMSCPNAIKNRGSCTTSRLRVVVALRLRGRHPGSIGERKRNARKRRVFKSGGISWTSSPLLPSARMRPSPSWIVIESSSITQTARLFSCLPRSASRRAIAQADWRSSLRS